MREVSFLKTFDVSLGGDALFSRGTLISGWLDDHEDPAQIQITHHLVFVGIFVVYGKGGCCTAWSHHMGLMGEIDCEDLPRYSQPQL